MIGFIYCLGSGRVLGRQFLPPGVAAVHLLSIITPEVKAVAFVLELLVSALLKGGAEEQSQQAELEQDFKQIMARSNLADLRIRMKSASMVLCFCPAFSCLQVVFLVVAVLVATLGQFRPVTIQISSSNSPPVLHAAG